MPLGRRQRTHTCISTTVALDALSHCRSDDEASQREHQMGITLQPCRREPCYGDWAALRSIYLSLSHNIGVITVKPPHADDIQNCSSRHDVHVLVGNYVQRHQLAPKTSCRALKTYRRVEKIVTVLVIAVGPKIITRYLLHCGQTGQPRRQVYQSQQWMLWTESGQYGGWLE